MLLFQKRRRLSVSAAIIGIVASTAIPASARHYHREASQSGHLPQQCGALRAQHQQAVHKALTQGTVVQAAYSLRGTRYVMGGTSRSGFDCSGFVRYILSVRAGVEMPRTATEQYYHGAPVAKSQLQPGDLVFFKNTYRHGISHVGIYAGNGKFVHAANAHRGVQEDDLNSSYYTAHFAGGRRVLPAQMRTATYSR